MEEYQEIVDFKKYLYFKGQATFKYEAIYNSIKSEETNTSIYNHFRYYDFQIVKINQISKNDFVHSQKQFEILNIEESTIGTLNHKIGIEDFNLEIDHIFTKIDCIPSHIQNEGDVVHGYFENVDVVFQMHRIEQKEVCIEGKATGNSRILNDRIIEEEFCHRDCSKYWVQKELVIEGEKRFKVDSIKVEDKIIPQVEPESWGNRFKKSLFSKLQNFYRDNFSNFFKEPNCILQLFRILGLVLLIYFAISWAISYHSFYPILFLIGLPLFFLISNYLLSGSFRLKSFFGKIVFFIGKTLLLLFILFLFKSIYDSFTFHPKNRKEFTPEDDKWSNQEKNNVKETDNKNDVKLGEIKIHLKWIDHKKNKYQGDFIIHQSDLNKSTQNLRNISTQNYSEVYNKVFNLDKNYLDNLYKMLDSVRISNQQNKINFAYTIVSMIQNIDYVLILDRSCNDKTVLRNEQIRKMLQSGIPCDGNAPYGIKTPLEFLTSFNGDCDTRTLLLYTILKHYSYDVAIINSQFYGHSMLGLNIEGARGMYKFNNGVKYYFWETTSMNCYLGELGNTMQNINYWKIMLN